MPDERFQKMQQEQDERRRKIAEEGARIDRERAERERNKR